MLLPLLVAELRNLAGLLVVTFLHSECAPIRPVDQRTNRLYNTLASRSAKVSTLVVWEKWAT